MSLRDFRSREVSELPDGVTKRFRFRGVTVMDLSTGEQVFLTGPVDLDKYGTIPLTFTARATGTEQTEPGISLKVTHDDGVEVDRELNLVSKRAVQQLAGDLSTGSYLKTEYEITAIDPPPRTKYTFKRTPLGPSP